MVESAGAPLVLVETTMGNFTVELYYKHAPKTCKNFLELSKKGYYNNVVGGDPTGTGRGGESIYGKKFEDEITRADDSIPPGSYSYIHTTFHAFSVYSREARTAGYGMMPH
eukprot:8105143-Pyramimonas_sp.AAC.3